MFRQFVYHVNVIAAKDSGANRARLTSVSGGTAYFTGNVLNQDYENSLAASAKTCGARAVNNNLRVGGP